MRKTKDHIVIAWPAYHNLYVNLEPDYTTDGGGGGGGGVSENGFWSEIITW